MPKTPRITLTAIGFKKNLYFLPKIAKTPLNRSWLAGSLLILNFIRTVRLLSLHASFVDDSLDDSPLLFFVQG